MAPNSTLLEAANARSTELQKAQLLQKTSMVSLEAEIKAKREEKSIAAQEAVRELLKQKEASMKEEKSLVGALSLIGKAVAKLQQALELGVSDWAAVHAEKIKLSSFARAKVEKEPKALESLKQACSGAQLVLQDGNLEFAGDKALVPKLKSALEALEQNYETSVEIDDEDTFSLLDSRDEISVLAKKNEVNIAKEGASLIVSGPPKSADKVADMIKALLAGKEDLDCPRNLIGAATKRAKEVESETGAIIATYPSGGWDGGGIMYIRGLDMCVEEATTALREWIDEHEGAFSEFVNISEDSGQWTGPLYDQFRNDAQMMGQKFGIAVKQTSTVGKLELRGLPDKVAEAHQELQMILGFYRKEHKKVEAGAAARAKAEEAPAAEAEDEWGAAPVAEPVVGAW